MANEATVRSSLSISVGNVQYKSLPNGFTADVSRGNGPSPGLVNVATKENGMTDIDLSELTPPLGFCRFSNQDANNAIHVGRYDPSSDHFLPFMKIKPGESFVIRLSSDITEEYTGTSTGTTSATSTLRAYAENASAPLLVEAFED